MSNDVDKLAKRAEMEARAGRMDVTHAILAFQACDFRAAIHYSERALQGTQEDLILYQLISHCFAQLGQTDEALRAMKKALEVSSDDFKTWRAIVGMEAQRGLATGRFQEATAILGEHQSKAKARGNKEIEFWTCIALHDLYDRLGKESEALEAARKAVALKPREPEGKARAVMMSILLARDAKDFQDCAKLAAEGIRLCKDHDFKEGPAQFHGVRTDSLCRLGRFEEALVDVRRLVKLQPEDKHALELLSMICLTLDRKKEALEAQEKVARLEPWNRGRQQLCASILAALEASKIDVD